MDKDTNTCYVVCWCDINCGEVDEHDPNYMYLCKPCAGVTTGNMTEAVRVRRQGDVK